MDVDEVNKGHSVADLEEEEEVVDTVGNLGRHC